MNCPSKGMVLLPRLVACQFYSQYYSEDNDEQSED